MSRFYTPEQALSEIVRYLNGKIIGCKEIIPAGSVPLGLYVDERPDLDVFIVTHNEGQITEVMKTIKYDLFRNGRIKEGELVIWFVEDYKGYPVDIVVISQDNDKVQTLNHVNYYREIMTDDLAKRIRWLKVFFKAINCYGAETGGITGICCTRMAELYDDTDDLFGAIVYDLMVKGHIYVEDPTLVGRDLFASVKTMKKKVMIQEITSYLRDADYGVNINTFFEDYRRIYRIQRKKRMGTDKEWQFVYSCLKKTWRSMKNVTKLWNVKISYDTLVTKYDIYVGVKITPDIIENNAFELIPLRVLSDEKVTELKGKGAYRSKDGISLVYPKKPPFKNVSREFERAFLERLHEKYTKIERE